MLLAQKVVEGIHAKDPRHEHLTEEDATKLSQMVKENQAWLDNTREILHSVQKHMTPPIRTYEIVEKKKAFDAKANPIMHKPKPKVEPPKETKAADNANANSTNEKNGTEPKENHTVSEDMDVE